MPEGQRPTFSEGEQRGTFQFSRCGFWGEAYRSVLKFAQKWTLEAQLVPKWGLHAGVGRQCLIGITRRDEARCDTPGFARPDWDRTWSDFGRAWPRFVQTSANSTDLGPISLEFSNIAASGVFGRHLTEFDGIRRGFVHLFATSAESIQLWEVYRIPSDLGQSLPGIVHVFECSVEFGPIDQISADMCRFRPNRALARFPCGVGPRHIPKAEAAAASPRLRVSPRSCPLGCRAVRRPPAASHRRAL